MGITVGANAWRKVERVMGDRAMSLKRKGTVLSYPGIHECTSDETNIETTGEVPGLRTPT